MTNAPTIDLGTKQISNGAGVNPVAFGYYPQEGSRACNLAYNWSVNLAYREDLTEPLKALGMITTAQSVFIDNSLNPGGVTLQIDGTQQVLVIPPYSQAMLPILFGENAAFWISTTANNNIATKVIVLNVPCIAGVWLAQPANIANNGSGIAATPLLGTQMFFGQGTGAANILIIPAVAGKRFFLSSLQIQASNNSTTTVTFTGELIITDGGANILETEATYPSVASTTLGNQTLLSMSSLNYISQGVNQSLVFASGATLTSGLFSIIATGGYTTQTP